MFQDERILMPPPSVVYKKGTLQYKEALERGTIQLSSPLSPLTLKSSLMADSRQDYHKRYTSSSPTSALMDSHAHTQVAIPAEEHDTTYHYLTDHSSPPMKELDIQSQPSCISQSQEEVAPSYEKENVQVQQTLVSVSSHHSSSAAASDSSSLASRKRKVTQSSIGDASTSILMEKTRFKDIIGHTSVKVRCDELLLPLWLPPTVTDPVLTGIRSMPASILLFGPPGCGKTKLAQALAGEARAAYLPVAPSDVYSKFVGESESSIRDVFSEAWERASQLPSRCAVVFFDEIDALAQSRGQESSDNDGSGGGCSRRVLAELLTQLNSVADGRDSSRHGNSRDVKADDDDEDDCQQTLEEAPPRILVVAATNRPEDLDPALLRRFGLQLYVGWPTAKDRKKIITRLLKGISYILSKQDIAIIVSATEGWSGSDIENVTRDAAMIPVRECMREAVIVRRRATKLEQSCGTASCQQSADDERSDPETRAANTLATGFQTLRPVSLLDFQQAIAFTRCGGQQVGQEDWYDSSSDEEEDNL